MGKTIWFFPANVEVEANDTLFGDTCLKKRSNSLSHPLICNSGLATFHFWKALEPPLSLFIQHVYHAAKEESQQTNKKKGRADERAGWRGSALGQALYVPYVRPWIAKESFYEFMVGFFATLPSYLWSPT